jgi:nucleotide-binding universal stress UspA family protein
MKNIDRILFPVDLTESSDKLVPYVTTMLQKFDAHLNILFVVRVFQYFTSINVPPVSINLFENELLDNARTKMEEFRKRHFGELIPITAEVLLGEPSETILGYIDDHRIDMVIMGTHGRKGIDRVIFGSVAERVIKTAPVPVLVVNPHKVVA